MVRLQRRDVHVNGGQPTGHDGRRRVLVVTPVLNGQALVGETVASVVGQTAVASGRVELDYVLADGGSRDGTTDAAKDAGGDRVEVVSRPDAGMYDALASVWSDRLGGPRAPDLMAYLNAGDVWQPHALDVVLDVMRDTAVPWVSGYTVVHNEAGQGVWVQLPYRYRRRLVQGGVYGRHLPHIQQESTFWSATLMAEVDLDRLRHFRLAGDLYLWHCFAGRTELTVVEALLGGFRLHAGQLSTDMAAYQREAAEISKRLSPLAHVTARLDAMIWHLPPRVKKLLNPCHLLRFDHQKQQWK